MGKRGPHQNLSEVTARVARDLDMPVKDVRRAVRQFFYEGAGYLAENRILWLPGLGVLRLGVEHIKSPHVKRLGKRKGWASHPARRHRTLRVVFRVRVFFTKSRRLKNLALQHVEEDMEKYGVDEKVNSEQLEKQAAKGCPECGSSVTKHGSVLICPVHGSEPFEEKRGRGQEK